MGKSKKKSTSEKKNTISYLIKMSSDCEKCQNKCDAGKQYLLKMTPETKSKRGDGVVCKGDKCLRKDMLN